MQKKDYIKIANARDSRLKTKKQRLIYRCFEILPGALAWLTLIGIVLMSWLAPVAIALFIIAFDIYWLLKTVFLSLHLRVAYKRMKKYLKVDWLKMLRYGINLTPTSVLPLTKGEKGLQWQEVYHLIILPFANEKIEVAQQTLRAIDKTQYPHNKMLVVLAAEARCGQGARQIGEQMEKEFKNRFFRFLVTYHPTNIPGELIGKGSNETWAGRQAKKEIIDPLKLPYEKIIVSCFDIDTRVFPQYFACLTYHFLKTPDRCQASFQPVPLYNNNLWQTSCFSRVVATSGTFWQMMQQVRPERLATFSSHAMCFDALVKMDFWNFNIVSEDSRIFWQASLFFDGDYRVVPLYFPISLDACYGGGFWRTLVNQYKQQRRWGWGVENIPYVLFGFLQNKKIPLRKKLRQTFNYLEGFWSWSTNALMIFLLGWLPLFLGGERFNVTVLSYNLPRLTRWVMTLAMVGLFASAIYSILLLPSRPARCRRWRYLIMIGQWLLLPITIMIFGCLPGLDAQTRLMLGRYMGFWNTEKPQKNSKLKIQS